MQSVKLMIVLFKTAVVLATIILILMQNAEEYTLLLISVECNVPTQEYNYCDTTSGGKFVLLIVQMADNS